MANYRQGGRGIALIAARRLDSYTTQTATVTSWLGGFVWGPQLSPRQSWNLVDTTLRWQAGRWLVVSSNTDPTPAPVPSIVYVNGPNDRARAFGRLAGMSAPFYGSRRLRVAGSGSPARRRARADAGPLRALRADVRAGASGGHTGRSAGSARGARSEQAALKRARATSTYR